MTRRGFFLRLGAALAGTAVALKLPWARGAAPEAAVEVGIPAFLYGIPYQHFPPTDYRWMGLSRDQAPPNLVKYAEPCPCGRRIARAKWSLCQRCYRKATTRHMTAAERLQFEACVAEAQRGLDNFDFWNGLRAPRRVLVTGGKIRMPFVGWTV